MSKVNRCTEFEREFIIEHHYSILDAHIAKELGRTEKQVRAFRTRNKIGTKRRIEFSADEIAFLKKYYSDSDMEFLRNGLPGRADHSIYGAAQRLGLNKSEFFMKMIQEKT